MEVEIERSGSLYFNGSSTSFFRIMMVFDDGDDFEFFFLPPLFCFEADIGVVGTLLSFCFFDEVGVFPLLFEALEVEDEEGEIRSLVLEGAFLEGVGDVASTI